jgi:hypothetical protein
MKVLWAKAQALSCVNNPLLVISKTLLDHRLFHLVIHFQECSLNVRSFLRAPGVAANNKKYKENKGN